MTGARRHRRLRVGDATPARGWSISGAASAPRALLLGGTSEIGLGILNALGAPENTQVILAGRDAERLEVAAKGLRFAAETVGYDATALGAHRTFIDGVFDAGPVDLVISAAGVLIPQTDLDAEPEQAGLLIETNFTGHVTTLLAVASRMRAQRHGTIVVLSSVAAVRPRRANYVYGASKAGLDAFARGLADALHGTGVRVLLVRPGFVTGRMTQGMSPAPLATTTAQVGSAVAKALDTGADLVWVPPSLRLLGTAIRLVPRPLWRRVKR